MAIAGAPISRDALILVPGIGGSELWCGDSPLWGMKPSVLYGELAHGHVLGTLRLDDPEADDGVRPGKPIGCAATIPGLAAAFPYRRLHRELVDLAADPAAVLAFGYDWRRSVEHAGARLAERASDHLDRWRRHPRGARDARLSLVCHSMGGLVAMWFLHCCGGRRDLGHVITIGTPFDGSLKAVRLLASGRVLRFGALADRLRATARSLPAVYELVARGECLAAGDGWRALTPADLSALGGCPELATAAGRMHERLHAAVGRTNGWPGSLRTIVGVDQSSFGSMTIDSGAAAFRPTHPDGTDWSGDGTVYRLAASPPGLAQIGVSQRHGALARSATVMTLVRTFLTAPDAELGPRMGAPLGLEVDDDVVAGEPFAVAVDPRGRRGLRAACSVLDADSGRRVAVAKLRPAHGRLVGHVTVHRPGLYVVNARGGGSDAVQELVLAA